MRQVGNIISMGVAMSIFAVFIGRVEIKPEYYPEFIRSLKLIFIIAGAFCFAGVFLSFARYGKR
ncbi:hypothetical protein ACFLXC_06065 [Chloroflexota bacterium]